MPENFIYGLFYGPQGPVTKRYDHYHMRFKTTWADVVAGKDNENLIEKTATLGKFNFSFATMFAIIDVVGYNNKGGYVNTLKRLKYHYVPWLGCTVAYTATVSTVCSLRGKTDQWNHAAGGFAAGALLGKITRSAMTGFLTGALFAFIGYQYKDADMNGWEVFPDVTKIVPEHGGPFFHKQDYTTNLWVDDRKGYWARTEAEVPEVMKRGQLGDGNAYKRLW